ncbi:UNVERIFIED_CONTAM: hypothetical protein RMT77_003974 [Armadillidium vulgare]
MGVEDEYVDPNPLGKFIKSVSNIVNAPVVWFRETIVVPNRPQYYWYHKKFRRVPTIDECYTDDIICCTEAEEQFKRDKRIDAGIVNILRNRMEECNYYERPDHRRKCVKVTQDYNEAANNYFIKYGDLGAFGDVVDCYMKQKHRMIWERRHGKVGTGMKPREEWGKETEE